MNPRRPRHLALALLLLLPGCGPALQPLPPSVPVPDLRGTWAGTWGGTPLTLTVVEVEENFGPSRISVGPVPLGSILGGQTVPTIAGVMTMTVRGAAVSTSVAGRLGSYAGRISMVLSARTPDGDEELFLTSVEPGRLTGSGDSTFGWGPRGPIELTRVPAGDAPAPRGGTR
jgi:hypothetical protein